MDEHQRFLSLFLKHQDDLRAYVGSQVRDWTAIDDIVQETAVVLWRKFSEYDAALSFGAWARGCATFEIRKYRERSGRLPALLSPEAIAAIEDAWEDAVPSASPRLEALAQCLHRIKPQARDLLSLRYRDGLELTEVAKRSGQATEAVAKMLQRVRVALADCVRRRLESGA